MSKSLDRMRDERIKALIKQVDLRRESDMAEASRRGRLLQRRRSPSPTCRCINAASASWTRHERARRCGLLASDHRPLHHHPRLASAMTDFAG